MTGAEVVERARGAIGRPTKYELGRGGLNPEAPEPASTAGACDCTGFLSWCYGVSREVRAWHPWRKLGYEQGWIESSMLLHEAFNGRALRVIPWEQARPGDALVFPDYTNGKVRRQGHVGIVSEVDASGPVKVVHCSSKNYLEYGDAIQETGADVFVRRRAEVVRPVTIGD